MESRSPMRAGAFSLLELLITVTAMAMLLSLLLATTGMVRDQARRVVCLNGIRTWGFMIFGYREDHRGAIPEMLNSSELDPSKAWVEEPTGGRTGLSLPLITTYVVDQPVYTGLPLNGATTVTYPATWRCPSWKPLRPNVYRDGNYWYSLPGYMYYGRSDLFSMPAGQRQFYTARQPDPQRLLMTDWVYYWYLVDLVRYSHGANGRCAGQNQLFGDGHGQWRAYTKAEGDSIRVGRTDVVPSIRNWTSYFYR